jgi:signal transduction histidine kinase
MSEIKILIVEDELIAAESLALDLSRLGYQIIGIVDSGDKVRQLIEIQQPDLILMDIMLKGAEDGINIAENIRENYQIPVIYLTAYADSKTLERAKQTSPYGYLVKPYKSPDLTTTIEIALQKAKDDQKIQQLLAKQEELNELKTNAIAMVSHDLKSPLTSILGTSEFIRKYGHKISQEKQDRCFERIRLTVKNMDTLIKELLIITQGDQGNIKLNLEWLDLVQLVREILDELRSLTTQNHQVRLITSKAIFQACFDPSLIRHIVSNLVSNAIKYSPDGGNIIIDLKFEMQKLLLTVQDQGIGIPENYCQNKLFSIFERGDNIGSIQGTGLGLAIVKKAVDLQKGNIEIKSKENVGTKVIVTLPINLDCQEKEQYQISAVGT